MRLIDADELEKKAYRITTQETEVDGKSVMVINLLALKNAKIFDTATERRGEWKARESFGGNTATCSACNTMFWNVDTCMGKPLWRYCPDCGARMDSQEAKSMEDNQ